jgi:hypothetical protein
MPSKLILLPTEMTINRAGLANGNGKRVVACDGSDSDEEAATGAVVSTPREDDVASESYPDSDAEEGRVVPSTKKPPSHGGAARKKVCSEGSSSSGSAVTTASHSRSLPSVATDSSRGSGATSSKLATITVSTAARKPSAWEMHRRKQEAKTTGR